MPVLRSPPLLKFTFPNKINEKSQITLCQRLLASIAMYPSQGVYIGVTFCTPKKYPHYCEEARMLEI